MSRADWTPPPGKTYSADLTVIAPAVGLLIGPPRLLPDSQLTPYVELGSM
jgi:hypothetical protein